MSCYYIEGIAREQVVLFPEALDDYIGEENPVRFVDAFVDSLDLKLFGFTHSEPKETGRPPYNPADLLKLYIYGYVNRIRSSRGLETEAHRNVEVMWLLRKLRPDFKTIADFRKDNKEAIKHACTGFTVLCKRLGLLGGRLVAVDSSKFRAVNSRRRNFNRAKLERAVERIDKRVEEYLGELEENDEQESRVSKSDGDDLRGRVGELVERGKKYRELLRELEESGERQVSLTDGDSRAMMNNGRSEVCYRIQTTVDAEHKLIVDYEVNNRRTDQNGLSSMAKRAKEILEAEGLEVLADKGYYDAVEIKKCVDEGINPYVPEPRRSVSKAANIPEPGYRKENLRYEAEEDVYVCPVGSELTFRGMKKEYGRMMRVYRSQDCKSCAVKAMCTRDSRGRAITRWEDEKVLEEMRERVRRDKDKMRTRQWLSEHPFGTIKHSFNYGYLLLKGLEKVDAEASLMVLAYNIKRAINIVGARTLIGAVQGAALGM